MKKLPQIFQNNRNWVEGMTHTHPDFFRTLARQQTPKYLWIGCSDSRVPANQIMGLMPGEVFVHRNISNVVAHSDLNCLSVIQFAVEMLKVEHIIVCGHYGCGGVRAACSGQRAGLIDNWLLYIRDTAEQHRAELDAITEEKQRLARLVELNVIQQAHNVCQTDIVQEAWERGQSLTVHGWTYGLEDGLLRDLGVCISSPGEIAG
ncbi:MAG: carbonate dehydratase [Gammaproteobacteria bacterium]